MLHSNNNIVAVLAIVLFAATPAYAIDNPDTPSRSTSASVSAIPLSARTNRPCARVVTAKMATVYPAIFPSFPANGPIISRSRSVSSRTVPATMRS